MWNLTRRTTVSPEQRDIAAAEERWRARNVEARAAGCPCGVGLAESVRLDCRNAGSVPVEFWTCKEHADVPLDYPWSPRPDSRMLPPDLVERCRCGSRRYWVDGHECGSGGPLAARDHAHEWEPEWTSGAGLVGVRPNG